MWSPQYPIYEYPWGTAMRGRVPLEYPSRGSESTRGRHRYLPSTAHSRTLWSTQQYGLVQSHQLSQGSLSFESRFETGNLEKAVRVRTAPPIQGYSGYSKRAPMGRSFPSGGVHASPGADVAGGGPSPGADVAAGVCVHSASTRCLRACPIRHVVRNTSTAARAAE